MPSFAAGCMQCRQAFVPSIFPSTAGCMQRRQAFVPSIFPSPAGCMQRHQAFVPSIFQSTAGCMQRRQAFVPTLFPSPAGCMQRRQAFVPSLFSSPAGCMQRRHAFVPSLFPNPSRCLSACRQYRQAFVPTLFPTPIRCPAGCRQYLHAFVPPWYPSCHPWNNGAPFFSAMCVFCFDSLPFSFEYIIRGILQVKKHPPCCNIRVQAFFLLFREHVLNKNWYWPVHKFYIFHISIKRDGWREYIIPIPRVKICQLKLWKIYFVLLILFHNLRSVEIKFSHFDIRWLRHHENNTADW